MRKPRNGGRFRVSTPGPFRRAVLFAAMVALTGCESRILNPAGSLRVEVEVYKGPLAKEQHVQWAELVGVVGETLQSLKLFQAALYTAAGKQGDFSLFRSNCGKIPTTFVPTDVPKDASFISCGLLYALEDDRRNVERFFGRSLDSAELQELQQLKRDPRMSQAARDLIEELEEFEGSALALTRASVRREFQKCYKKIHVSPAEKNPDPKGKLYIDAETACEKSVNFLSDIAESAARLKYKANYWANIMASIMPGSFVVRSILTGFANLTSQQANLMSGRADALVKQLQGVPAHRLPLSVYLRDSNPSDFPNMLIWTRAGAPALIEDIILHPIDSLSSEETTNRIRMTERLFADEFWTRTNVVYGSGTGDFSMALIKDDIGNWNLKSFDNDPSELLEAYTNITLDVAGEVAAAITTSGASAIGDAEDGLSLLGRLSSGRLSGDQDSGLGLNIQKIKSDADQDLQNLNTEATAKENTYADELASLEKRVCKAPVQAPGGAAPGGSSSEGTVAPAASGAAVSPAAAPVVADPDAPPPAAPATAADSSVDAGTPVVGASPAPVPAAAPVVPVATAPVDTAAAPDPAAPDNGDGGSAGENCLSEAQFKAETEKLKTARTKYRESVLSRAKQVVNDFRAVVEAMQKSILPAEDQKNLDPSEKL